MKRLLAAALAVLFIFSLSGCGSGGTLQEGDSALDYMVQAAESFKYGKLRCYKYSTADTWSLISCSREDAVFGKNSLGSDSALYRMSNPVVFIYWPAYDYYDGDYYYYKHDGEWFIDGYGRFAERLKASYYGLDPVMFRSLKLVENEVYRTGSGYRLHLLGLNSEDSVVRIDMDVNERIEPQYLIIRTYPDGEDHVEYIECHISDYNNAELSADKPSGLKLSEVNYMRKDYEEK